jgi:hypothetical protein
MRQTSGMTYANEGLVKEVGFCVKPSPYYRRPSRYCTHGPRCGSHCPALRRDIVRMVRALDGG